MKVEKIKIHPVEMGNQMACCIAYCIGANHENVEEIANKIPESVVDECIVMIRDKMEQTFHD